MTMALDAGKADPNSSPDWQVPAAHLGTGTTHHEGANDLDEKSGDWLSCLQVFGISAAILSYAQNGALRRQALVRGFDSLKSHPEKLARVLGEADRIWATQTRATPMLQFLEPPGALAEVASGAMIAMRFEGATACLRAVFFRNPEHGAFPLPLLAAIDKLMPTLAMSAAAHVAQGRAERRYRMLQAALDRLAMPVILLDRAARVLHRNDAADLLLAGERGLAIGPDEQLTCAGRGQTRALHDAVRAVADAPPSRAAPRVVALGEAGREVALGYVCQTTGDDMRGCATLIVPPATVRAVPVEAMEALGLLPSERRFLSAFLSADGVREAALAAGVSEETGRTYLKRIKLKLGVSRQVDLVRLMCSLTPPVEGLATAAAISGE